MAKLKINHRLVASHRLALITLTSNTPLWLSMILFLSGVIVTTLLGLMNLTRDLQYHYILIRQIVLVVSLAGFIVLVCLRWKRKSLIADYRKDRFRHPQRVGILSGMINSNSIAMPRPVPDLRTWSQLFPDPWVIEFLNPSQIDDKFCFIVNPIW